MDVPSEGGVPPTTSLSRELARRGVVPGDLITSIMMYTERSKAVGLPPLSPGTPGTPTRVAGGAGGRQPQAPEACPAPQTPLNTGELRMRADSSALKQSHWKPVEKAVKCANPSCLKKFTWKDRRRNCCMCGEVFCRSCTSFRRKLSSNADPDPLGTVHLVCERCSVAATQVGRSRNLMKLFKSDRGHVLAMIKRDNEKPFHERARSGSRQAAIRAEADRLTEGFQLSRGFVRGLISDFRVPDWQKSKLWKPSNSVSRCCNSKCRFQFRMTSRKIHCRVCGQVFCTTCTQDEILLYLDPQDRARWAINGKEGGPKTPPERFEMLRICSWCSEELQSVLLLELALPPPEVFDFVAQLANVHKKVTSFTTKIDEWLPQYQKLVDALDIEPGAPNSVGGRHPFRRLIKVQSDLSDIFSRLAVHSQSLKKLQPQTDPQKTLVRHMMIGTYQFYSENMYLFRASKARLAELMPVDGMDEMQSIVNHQSMDRIHLLIQQLIYEAISLKERYKLDSDFLTQLVEVVKCIEAEFSVFLEKRGEDWKEHVQCVNRFVEGEMKNNRRRIDVSRHQAKNPRYLQYLVVSQCSTVVHECLRELEAKTTERSFPETKESMRTSVVEMDSLLATIQDFHRQRRNTA